MLQTCIKKNKNKKTTKHPVHIIIIYVTINMLMLCLSVDNFNYILLCQKMWYIIYNITVS